MQAFTVAMVTTGLKSPSVLVTFGKRQAALTVVHVQSVTVNVLCRAVVVMMMRMAIMLQ